MTRDGSWSLLVAEVRAVRARLNANSRDSGKMRAPESHSMSTPIRGRRRDQICNRGS
jgi:hypothetical protein